MFDSIIFDMDGVLIDSEKLYFEQRFEFCKEQNIKFHATNFLDHVGLSGEEIWKTIIPEEKQRKKILESYTSYRKSHSIDFTEALRPEVPNLLQELKKREKKIALASSSPLRQINQMLSTCQLSSYFDFVISGHELSKSKPHPEIYQKSQQALGGIALAVDDSPIGIQSAKAAGLYTVALEQDFLINQSKADLRIKNLLELLPIV